MTDPTPAFASTPPREIEALPVREVAPGAPWRWLKAGWRDFLLSFGPSVAHGLVVMLAGMVIVTVGLRAWWLLPGAISGFLLVGPIVATGLYELSRRSAASPATCARHRRVAPRRAAAGVAGTGTRDRRRPLWVLVSAVLVALFVTRAHHRPRGVRAPRGAGRRAQLFPLWALLGGFGASRVFAATVVSAPLLLDRASTSRSALLHQRAGGRRATRSRWPCGRRSSWSATALSLATRCSASPSWSR